MKKSCADLFLWNKSAENYISSQKISDFAKVNQLIVANRFPQFHGEAVLDLGCGPGWYTEYFRSHGAFVIGCDGSETMVEKARSTYPLCHFDLSILGEPFPYEDAIFDMVFCNQVLMDVEHLSQTLSEISRVLKNNGLFYMSIVHPAFYDAPWMADEHGFLRYKKLERYLSEYSFSNFFWGETKHYHRPLSIYINKAISCGLQLVSIDEPPTYDGKEKSSEFPLFLFMEFHKSSSLYTP